ncbi:hypothetical protein GCM10010468_56690 [Actinocorallia longicatena]|uniref:DUF11 domain-containing protein n=2 Tax=Actinocorallia longicatena TaxID=111803 RepID=A0ABP6QK10_9ACTN
MRRRSVLVSVLLGAALAASSGAPAAANDRPGVGRLKRAGAVLPGPVAEARADVPEAPEVPAVPEVPEAPVVSRAEVPRAAVRRGVLNVGLGVEPGGKVRQGTVLSYVARVRNAGTAAASGVRVSVVLPAGVGLLGVGGDGCVEQGNGALCRVGSLEVGGSAAVTVSAVVKARAGGEQIARAVVSGGNALEGSGTASVFVRPGTDLAVRLAAPRRAVAGRAFTMVARVVNRGSVAAGRVRVALGTERARIVGLAENCRARGDEGRCDLGRLAPGESATVRVRIVVDPDAHGVIGNFAATASADVGDVDPENNTAVALVEVVAPVVPQGRMLPETGTDPVPLAALGLMLVVTGCLLLRFER